MNRNKIVFFYLLLAACLFNLLFWKEGLALNLVVFDMILLPGLFYLYPAALSKPLVMILLAAHLASSVILLVQHTAFSLLAYFIIQLLLFAYAEYQHRSAWYAGGSILLSGIHFPRTLAGLMHGRKSSGSTKFSGSRWIRFALVPLLLLAIFVLVYQQGNTVFAGWTLTAWERITWVFTHFLSFFSWDRFFFSLLGLFLTGTLLLRTASRFFEKREAARTDVLIRVRKNRRDVRDSIFFEITVGLMGKLARGCMALKNELTVGLISLVLLNGLLLVINVIDIRYVWFQFSFSQDTNLTRMIHQGTEVLILSILLAMGVLLFFFRGNLNFYSRNKMLKLGAYGWILQNLILVVSVFIRDYYYIKMEGLAYKRIGVLAFLLLVLVGLLTVLVKIQFKKTNYFLFRVNAWAFLLVMMAGSAVQWDALIARYNISHSDKVPLDIRFLISLSDEALPVLDQNLPLLQKREKELADPPVRLKESGGLANFLLTRKRQFLLSHQDRSWLSWNLADQSVRSYVLRSQVPPKSSRP
jgi:hypothetical protein